jgi:hypothetical protein
MSVMGRVEVVGGTHGNELVHRQSVKLAWLLATP